VIRALPGCDSCCQVGRDDIDDIFQGKKDISLPSKRTDLLPRNTLDSSKSDKNSEQAVCRGETSMCFLILSDIFVAYYVNNMPENWAQFSFLVVFARGSTANLLAKQGGIK